MSDNLPKDNFAFPFSVELAESTGFCTGMELRDYFAAKVLGGFITALAREINVETNSRVLAESAYALADAMIAARSKA